MDHAKKRSAVAVMRHKVLDEVRFLRSWIDRPLMVGAVAPSSPQLAKLMASYVDPARPGLVAELGPGTGVVTQALIERGVAPSRIASIEFDGDFYHVLHQRFPGVHFVHGDAYRLRQGIAPWLDPTLAHPLAAVVSSLPLFTRPLPERLRLLEDSFALMPPGAPFIQFSYALVPPVPKGAARFEIERSSWVVRNLPPARVWIYRRPA
ncbi:phospholipid methyltransferase [Siculibacillus lacustris]|uniref:Phospholipid methyltransferase n=1 Tax=Siculibacillus lacustris TaxID=1549641 RepID=A0A4Q9VT08_9HYPH|nr:phospholipid methyltransferase [Siculibacillus lacustris]TBW39196.1 phospholipid methyltransferase [Siculibacillus lacustris]